MGGGREPRRATPAPKARKARKEEDPRKKRIDASKRRAGTILTGTEGAEGQALTTILGG